MLAAKEAPAATRVYRVEGSVNRRIIIGSNGEVTITGDATLYLNFGDQARAWRFRQQRRAKGMSDAEIKSFDVPTSYVDQLRASSVSQRRARKFPNRPFRVDETKAADQFGLRACQLPGLQGAIVQGSGRVGC